MPVLMDLLCHDLDVVFCGTAAGTESAKREQYYAGPGNRFWKILHQTGLTPGNEPLSPSRWRELTEHGIGLTDLSKTASGPDSSLPSACFDPDRLRQVIASFAPRFLAFNGRAAAKIFLRRPVLPGRQPETILETAIWVLPSTSGAANGTWDSRPWHEIAQAILHTKDADRHPSP